MKNELSSEDLFQERLEEEIFREEAEWGDFLRYVSKLKTIKPLEKHNRIMAKLESIHSDWVKVAKRVGRLLDQDRATEVMNKIHAFLLKEEQKLFGKYIQ